MNIHQHRYRDGLDRGKRHPNHMRMRRAKDHLDAASSLVAGAVLDMPQVQAEKAVEAREQLQAALDWLNEVQ